MAKKKSKEIVKNKKKFDEPEKIQDKVETIISDDIQWNKPLILFYNFIYGLLMGFSDGVPGYSGGTTLSIMGFYDKLINNIKSIFKPTVKKDFWKYLLWFLPFAIGWILIISLFLYIVKIAGDSNSGIILVSLFASLSLFSIPLFYMANKDSIPNPLVMLKSLKSKDKKSLKNVSLFSIGILVMLTIALCARFIPASGGVSFLKNSYQPVIDKDGQIVVQTQEIVLLLIAGFLAGFFMLVPGISGSLIMYMFGVYGQFSYMAHGMLSNANYIPYVIFPIICMIIGAVVSSISLSWVLKKFKQEFNMLSFGFVSFSFAAILIALSSNDYATLNKVSNIGGSIAMIFLAMIISGILFVFLNQTNKIHYPKYRIKFLDKHNKKESLKN